MYRDYNYKYFRQMNNNMNNNHYSYNRNGYYQRNDYNYRPIKQKKSKKWLVVGLSIFACFILLFVFLIEYSSASDYSKNRTFMIYMVGSDLESKSKQGTYSINDIDGKRIDLAHNNVILMVGGSKKWHNFVSTDEIGIYELTIEGFKKKESLAIKSMGSSEVLTDFLNYTYDNYPAKNYDLIFWNHGLGAIGVEQDELSNDYLSVTDLDSAFSNSKFSNKKLELTIFYNCLEGNLHIANIMSKYSDYMVASEEVLYLSKVLNRFNFLENVSVTDDAVAVAKYFIEQSDEVVNAYNSTHANQIDSTLSVLDLRRIQELNNNINEFIRTINIQSEYFNITSIRKNLYTYGRTRANDYDTVDLYELVSALAPLSSNNRLAIKVLDSIEDTVIYNSSFNSYSNGISIYFPFYGNDLAIGVHLSSFKKLLYDDYYTFIKSFYDIRSGSSGASKRSNMNLNILDNDLITNNGEISIELKPIEKEKYQYANIYLFKRIDDEYYELVLDSDKVDLEGNKLVFKDNKLLTINNDYYSFISDNSQYIYGKLSDDVDELNTIFNLRFDGNLGEIVGTILDSGIYPLSGLVEYDDYNKIAVAKLNYKIFDDGYFDKDWRSTEEKEFVNIDKNNIEISLGNNNLDEYYALIEFHDVNNEVYYSKIGIFN